MVIRARNAKEGLQIFAYANGKGRQAPLAKLIYDRPIAEITADELRVDMAQLRNEAVQKFGKISGLLRYTSKEIN